MKHKYLTITLLLLLSFPLFADVLSFAPCDEVTVNLFGDIITLSKNEGILRRYVKGKLMNVFSSRDYASKISLNDPLRPILDEPDKIYCLDLASNTVISWDRFLNIHSITPLHEDILSPQAFTVTSEHDWLIYDNFYDQILQVHPGEKYLIEWGDKNVSGNIELLSVDQRVLIFFKDIQKLRFSDEEGRTLAEYAIPDSIKAHKIIPINKNSLYVISDSQVYIWKPIDNTFRYLIDLEGVIYAGQLQEKLHVLITKDGEVLSIP